MCTILQFPPVYEIRRQQRLKQQQEERRVAAEERLINLIAQSFTLFNDPQGNQPT